MNTVYDDLVAMGVDDVEIIGVGKDEYNSRLEGMINGRTLPWVSDIEEDGYPVWDDYGAVQRSTYFLDREGGLIYQFNITTLDPTDPEDYNYLINLILDYRADNGPSVIRVTQDYSNIQDAIDNAFDGDIVLVDPGTYIGNINFLDKSITLATLVYSGFRPDEIENSILDGAGEGPVVTINEGQDQSAILLGFEITNGSAEDYGGGILIEDASPTIDRNIIHNNNAGSCGGAGGGIAVIGESYPYIFGNTIYNNNVSGDCDCICYFGGGLYVDSPSWPVVGGSITLGNTFYDNYSDDGLQLFRDHTQDTSTWTPIYAHHNFFEFCPPDSLDVYPLNGWDLENCHTMDIATVETPLPSEAFYVYPIYPNPFNPLAKLKFDLQYSGTVDIVICDIMGRIILSDQMKLDAGIHQFEWNASKFSSGIYFIRLSYGAYLETQKALLVK